MTARGRDVRVCVGTVQNGLLDDPIVISCFVVIALTVASGTSVGTSPLRRQLVSYRRHQPWHVALLTYISSVFSELLIFTPLVVVMSILILIHNYEN